MTMDPNSPGTILVADDEESVRFVLVKALESVGHTVLQASGGREALDRLRERPLDLAFVDLRMPDYDGLAVLAAARESGLTTPVVIVTAQNTMDNAIEAMKRGAYDYIAKPFNIDEVQAVARRALEMARMSTDLKRVEREMRGRFEVGVAIIGNSPAMQEIYKIIGRIANTDTTILVQGESGTGKELIAKVIHYHSPRWSGPFIAINCSAIPRELLESELFGHEKGAFTGATEQRPGKFELAQGGTILLDEIADMPLELQAKLLRVLQEREVTRLGGRETLKVDCRILAATNQSLERAAKQGRFREDLFFRLAGVPIDVPPLRDRRDDVPLLFTTFLHQFCARSQRSALSVDRKVFDALAAYDWPGNVRELRNLAERLSVFGTDPITPEQLPSSVINRGASESGIVRIAETAPVMRLREFKTQCEKEYIESVLRRTEWNISRAAQLLDLQRTYLHEKMAALGITRPETA